MTFLKKKNDQADQYLEKKNNGSGFACSDQIRMGIQPFGNPDPSVSSLVGKPQKNDGIFFSGPATKALPPPLELSGHKKISIIVLELQKMVGPL